QSQTALEQGRILVLPVRREIPEATLPCTPAEAKWWQELRAAADAVKKSRAHKKEKESFMRLLLEGQEKSYQPPVPDVKPFFLYKAEPKYTERARQDKIGGRVVLRVELRADGFVGEVEIIEGLRADLDERAADAARNSIFLPAVKNRQFVPFHVQMEMFFRIY
ncbi:MAG: energy transducer TonB, partial [Pyrinomonadaceae bacterium]